MTTPLPPGTRVSAYFYAARAGMVSVPQEPGDLEFLRELGLRAASLARWEGIPAVRVPEGPYQVYLWPPEIFEQVASQMAPRAAPGPPPPSAAIPRDEVPAGVPYRELTDAEEAAENATWD